MATAFRKFLENPAHFVIFLPLAILAIFVIVNYFTFPHEVAAPAGNSNSAATAVVTVKEAKPQCPASFECCPDGDYSEKSCLGAQACVANKCEKKECPFACCDDESSRAQYKAKGCDGNFLCDANKCVQRKCWKECCTNDPAYEDKACPGTMECIDNKCEKPACPDKFLCCAADDSTYRQKDCPGRGVCKFRVCKSH